MIRPTVVPSSIVKDTVPPALRNGLGVAIAKHTSREYRGVLASPRWRGLEAAGARLQRLLWATTSTKDPAAPDTLYVEALAAQLQREGAESFDASWKDLLDSLATKRAAVTQPDPATTRPS